MSEKQKNKKSQNSLFNIHPNIYVFIFVLVVVFFYGYRRLKAETLLSANSNYQIEKSVGTQLPIQESPYLKALITVIDENQSAFLNKNREITMLIFLLVDVVLLAALLATFISIGNSEVDSSTFLKDKK